MVILATNLLIVSFIAYSSMATLNFHYYSSIFSEFKNQQFWNPIISNNNKYKDGNKLNGEAFFGSTWIFVWTTDGYHLMQFIFENSLFLSMAFFNSNFAWYLSFLGIRIIYGIIFNLFFDKILLK